jgi:hypothetical protein
MLRRVSDLDPIEYLRFFETLGYEIAIVDREKPGHTTKVDSAAALLAVWGDELRIEDLLLSCVSRSESRDASIA